MRYIKTYEDIKKRGRPPFSPLKKLYNFLRKKGLNVEYILGDQYGSFSYRLECIRGDDYLIYEDGDKYFVSYISGNFGYNKDGDRCGEWGRKYFKLDQLEEIYLFVKGIKDINDMNFDIKKYNL